MPDFLELGMPKKARKGVKGETSHVTGPVQFSWGYSLHPVETVESSSITSLFVGRETEGRAYGTIGKDYRLYYSLIAFYGLASGNRGKKTGLKERDLVILDHLLCPSLKLEATTRSKIGENPLLYMRVEYTESDTLIGDLRRFVKVSYENESIRSLKDLKIDTSDLARRLNEKQSTINKIYLWTDESIRESIIPIESKMKDQIIYVPYAKLNLPDDLIIKEEK